MTAAAAVAAAVGQAQPPLEAALQVGRGGGMQLPWGWSWGASTVTDQRGKANQL